MSKILLRFRLGVQAVFVIITNSNFVGFARGTLYKGELKQFCLPGLNCYSCPGALGACPIGSLQALLGSYKYKITFYVAGFLIATGAILGRIVCGFLCPFGLVQDLLYKIPIKFKRNRFRFDKPLRYLKYAVLFGVVITLPIAVSLKDGVSTPWFCKLICPSGALFAGIPLSVASEGVRAALGSLFLLKITILGCVSTLSAIVYRPFCKYLCPLGAIYAFFNRIALFRLIVDESKCTHCGKCAKACEMCVDPARNIMVEECVRCGDCVKACDVRALKLGLSK